MALSQRRPNSVVLSDVNSSTTMKNGGDGFERGRDSKGGRLYHGLILDTSIRIRFGRCPRSFDHADFGGRAGGWLINLI